MRKICTLDAMKTKLAKLDALIGKFQKIAADFPGGGYEKTVAKLQQERAELANTIGKKKS